MKLTERTDLREYVSPETYKEYGNKAVRFIDTQLINADLHLTLFLEAKLGRPVSITINDWCWGGKRVASGLRTPGTSYYRITSAHAWGKGSDKKFRYKDGAKEVIPNQVVYDLILENQKMFYDLGIRRMEYIKDAPTWLHWDTIHTGDAWTDKIQIVRA